MIATPDLIVQPDQRALDADLAGGPFRIGVAQGLWVAAEPPEVPEDLGWPLRVFWVQAAPRPNAPDRFFFRFDFENYPIDPATGTLWDPLTKQTLAFEKRPKGTGQTGKVFRTDWENGRALYHPYDRVAAFSHRDWPNKYPQKVWTRRHTIVDLLTEIHFLLQTQEYSGVERQ